jgi:hypothetical protein
MADSPLALLYDSAGQPVSSAYAPVSGRPAQATYNPQGGLTVLGHDYGTSNTAGTAYVPRVDSGGYLYVKATDATQAGTAVASSSAVIGNVLLALQGLVPASAQMDSSSNILAAPAAQATFSVYSQAVQLANGKSLLCLLNKSVSSVLRLVAVYAQNTGTSPSGTTTYNVFAEQMHFIAGFTGGTSLTPVSWDSADTLASGITCASAATVSGEVTPAIRRWVTSSYPLAPGATAAEDTTADQQGRDAWVGRLDASAKSVTIRPGQGVHVKAASTVSNGYQDVTFVFTQSAA